MSKEEERALEAYPKMSRIAEPHGVIPSDYESHYIGDANEEKRIGFVEGYHQAEKDLELTWEDLAIIKQLSDDFIKHNQTPMSDGDFYEEVLKRFKDLKK